MDQKRKKGKKGKKDKPVAVHITNHNQFQKGVGAFITNLNHLTIIMDSEGNMKMDASQVPVMPQAQVEDVQDEEEVNDEVEDGEDLVAKLLPIFYNKEEDVRLFLNQIRGMATEDITELVNQWVKEKRISDYGNSRKGVLWGILHKAGLYKRTKSNWCGRVY